MRSILLLAATMAILYIVTSSAVATSTSTSSEYDDYNDDYEESSTTTNKSSPKTSSTEYYEEEESNSSSNNEYEDEESEYEEEEDSSASTSSHKQPYNCPSQCKCRFKRRSGQSSEYDDEEDYDYEKESVKLKRVRREVGKNKTSDEYLYDYEDHSTSKKSRTHHVKYDITVDCSAQGLFTIADLFDYDFPLDQIVSFNLSSNKFRLLRLDDGFEDLLNLKELDISSNPYLKSISPRNFLKKFRFLEKIHLNNLPQINCQENEKTGRIVSIDCKWYRTLLYLHKRNISIDFHYFNRFSHQSGSVNEQSTPKCTLGSLINNQANNIALISRCLTDFDSSDRPSSGSNRVKGTSNQTKIYNIDNVQYEFRIEPDLSQLLIEGDSLELTCRLIKKSSLAKKQPPFNSQIKWYLNEKQQLMISSIFYNNENPTQIEIFESKLKRQQHTPPRTNTEETVIESKLLITNTMSSQHTGKYSCSAIIEDSSGVKRTPISTSRVDIKVLGRQQLDANGVASNQAQVTKTMSTKMPTTTPMAYCDEMIVQTYRGVYKWPRTLANSKLSQKCVFTAATANGGPNKANETSNVVAIECLADGRWSDQIDTRNCMFESNLTRYLARFAENKEEVISRPDLDEFIHKIVSIQSEPKSRLGGGIVSSNPSPVQITTYDIIYIESFLLTALQHLKFVSTDQSKSSWRHKFIWLSDMLGRLNEFYIRRAQSIHPNTFSSFFFEALLPVSLTNTNNDLSTTLASSRLSRLTNTACCVLRRVQLTQQLEFICNAACRPIIDPSNNLPKLTQVQAVFSQLNSSLEFVVLENDRLIPVNLNLSTRNYDILTFAKPSTTTALNGHRVNRTCSQIVALRGRSVERVDLTIEIDLPRSYSRLLKLIYTQLANVSAANSERSSVDRNLFEYIFQSDRADFLRDESDVDEDDLPVMIISNGEWSTIAGSIEVDSNGAERGAAAVRRDERLVKSELRMARFRDELVNKWLNPLSYEVVYGLERNFTQSDDSNRTYRLIDWATSMDGFRCTLINVHINWQPNSSIQFTDLFRTYAVLSCNQTSTSQSSDKLTMIGVRHRSEINTTSSKSSVKNVAITQLFEKYSSAFKLDLDSSANNLGPIDRFLHSMRLKYRLFEHRLVYAASALVSILLVANILLYSTLHASLQMPRSFYHVFVNKWLAIAGLNAIYAIGSAQIHLPHLCFFTAAASHYLLLASFAWYAIFFYVLYKKLAVLKRRNAVLIFNPELANKIDREPEDEDDDECHGLDGKNQGFIKRPVIHLYMIAWGLPLALCSIIISITRQDYIQTPYSYCFTNEPNILVGSVMLPIVFVFAAQFVIVMLILRTLRRIMIDLKHDELINGPQDDADDYEDEVKVSPGLATDRVDDRQELCKNWLNSKTAKDQQGTYNGTRVGSHADNLAATDMIEIKMNPITQKSLVINHSAYTTALGGAAEDSSTSFERESSLDSDRTSVMDTQYKPHVQLKFAFISWLVYFVLCALAASLTLVSTSPSPDPFLLRLFSFFFVVFAAAYAIMQFVFYSLSRDDVCGQFGICSVSLFGGKKVEMADNVDEYDDTKKCPDEVDNRADYETKSDVIEGVEKWSYEPKVIVPTPTLRENNATVSLLPNVVANNPSSPPKITLDDCIYEKYQFRSIAEKDKTQTETLIVTTTTLATSTSATKEGGFESLSMSKKVSQNEEKLGLEEDTSAEEEIISDDDDHKKSISDVLFSAAKKTSPTTTASQKTKHDSPKQALNYKESPSNHPTSERNEMSTSSPLITSSGVEIDEEDVTESDETSTHSYADSNVNHVILNAPYQLEQQQHHKIVNHCPTLAVQEDMSDYITLTPQPAEQQHHQSIAKTPASLSVPKRSNHVRNPSLLSGATAQTIQLITGSNFINDSETRDRKQQQPQSQPQQPSKRPLYVYVDHSYEEKLQTETTTSTTTTRKEANTIEPRSKRTNSRKNLLNDLLTNTCTSHIGNAIDSIVPAASSSTSSTSSQHNHQTTKLVQSKSMTIGTSNSSATTTRTSSMVSSSSTNEHLDVDEETQPMQQLPPQPKYRQSSVARLVANNAVHTTKTLPHSHVTARLDSTAAARLSASLLDTPPTNTTATNAKNNLIQRPPRLRDFEPKHETSV